MSNIKEKLHTGELYFPGDEEIMKEQIVYQDLLCEYNLTKPSKGKKSGDAEKNVGRLRGRRVY